ncbi:MAG: VWA domain-containing protein [Granulosicoccus sp.]
MNELVENFRFMRPLWLLTMPVVVLTLFWHARRLGSAGWSRYIDHDKLKHLVVGGSAQQSWYRPWVMLFPLLLACVALAGPSWKTLPGNMAANRQAMVILFDLSPSMLAQDIKPTRLERASFKLIDLLRTRSVGETALIVYAGDAYRVTPLTDDPATIGALVPTLHPSIMPVSGSHPEAALELALSLFDGAGLSQGDIVVITDGIHLTAADYIKRSLPRGYRLSILGVGTASGAPIPTDSTGFMRDANDQIIVASLDDVLLTELADHFDGRYHRVTADSSDVEYLGGLSTLPFSARIRSDVHPSDSTHDAGYWLVLLLLPLAVCLFRRNLIWAFLPILLFPPDSHAWSWTDLWLTDNQQAEIALRKGRSDLAAELFEQTQWIAVARYRNGEFAEAAVLFSRGQGADDFYNLGNAEALAGRLEHALLAYEKSLALEPGHADALYNREFLQAILRQRNEQDDAAADEQNRRGSGGGDDEGESADAEPGEMDAESGEQRHIGGSAGVGQTLNQQTLQDAGQSSSLAPVNEPTAELSDDATPVQRSGALTDREIDNGVDADSGAVRIEDSESAVLNPYSEQWLRSLPRDPGGFLRRKFHYQARMRAEQADVETLPMEEGRY